MSVSSSPRPPLTQLLTPRKVAVFGAGHLGRLVIHHLIQGGFDGELSIIGSKLASMGGVHAVEDIAELDNAPDLVVIAVAREAALEAIESCASMGCGAAIVVTAGFAEAGSIGIEAQRSLVYAATKHKMRILGPNCMGLINTSPEARLHASFGVGPAPRGPLSLISQSGSVADYALYHSKRWGLGVSIVASVGNEADVTTDELLRAVSEDSGTGVIACYIEEPAKPKALLHAIEEASMEKPVVIMKGGRTITGRDAAASHTGRLASGSGGSALRSLIEAAGGIIVETLEEMMAVCTALARHPEGCGNRIGVVTNAGGPGVLAVDDLDVRGWTIDGPMVDLTASARVEHFEAASRALSGRVDALLCLIMSPEGTDPTPAVDRLSATWSKPLAFSLLARGPEVSRASQIATSRGIPVSTEPRLAVASLTALRDRGYSKSRPQRKDRSTPSVDLSAVENIESAARGGASALGLLDGFSLCHQLGVPVVPFKEASSADEAECAALSLGFPVMLKVDAPGVLHKTEHQAVVGPIFEIQELRKAYTSLVSRDLFLGARLLVQRFSKGIELILGVTHRTPWGAVMIVGKGGVDAEIIEDVAYLPATATREDIADQLLLLKMGPILGAFRGQQPVDVEGVTHTATMFSALASRSHLIYEIEANPFMVDRDRLEAQGVADIRVVLRNSTSADDRNKGRR